MCRAVAHSPKGTADLRQTSRAIDPESVRTNLRASKMHSVTVREAQTEHEWILGAYRACVVSCMVGDRDTDEQFYSIPKHSQELDAYYK